MTALHRPSRRSPSRLVWGIFLPLVALHPLQAAPPRAETSTRFEDCEARLESAPESAAVAACFYELAVDERSSEEAMRRMRALQKRHPRSHWLEFYLGHIEWTRGPEGAIELYAAAADGFAEEGDAAAEVRARYNLRNVLYEAGKIPEAALEVERTLEVARRSGDPHLEGQALVLEARHLREIAQDVGRAYRVLRRAEPMLFPDGPYLFRRAVIRELAGACFTLGRLDEALSYYRRYETITREAADGDGEAFAKLNIANTLLMKLEELPNEERRREVAGLAEGALELAIAAGNPRGQVLAHQLLGDVMREQEPDRARSHLEECLEGARRLDDPEKIGDCLGSFGALLAGRDPRAARRLVDEAASLASESGNQLSVVYASRQRMRVAWKTEERDEAVERSLEALDTIEALRNLQHDTPGSSGIFSAWTKDYYFVLGSLLDRSDGPPNRADVELAFSIAERLRARILLEKIAAARPEPAPERMRPVLEALVDVHRRLLSPGLAGEARRAALAELERLELEEEALRAEGARAAGEASPIASVFATLQEVEAGLASDEALLSFQVALWQDVYGDFGGGAFLIASTRDGTRVFRLPDRTELESAIPVFMGLFERRDGSEEEAAAALYRMLLQEAVDGLPPGVRRLILVPDGSLHRLPFAALRKDVQSEPLAIRYELTTVPSATLWLRWRKSRPAQAKLSALAFADPVLMSGPEHHEAAETRAWLIPQGARLGALPHARREARSLVRRLGAGSRLRLGEEASESFVKSSDLQPYKVLHFAVHAVVDETHPERSAVLLAPGSESEDGLLQARDIVALELDGHLVVLSACRTVSGAVVSGEGVLGLARAFFQAGAHAVVGSLWPLRDDEAALFFELFYEHLASGKNVAAAMKAAQSDAIERGLPGAAWAGVVALGDGSLSMSPVRAGFLPWLALVGAAGLVSFFLLRRLRRARSA